jgi:hypothetical protein
MASAIQAIGAAVLTLAATELAANKTQVLALVDTGIQGADAQVKDAIGKAMSAHGVLGLFVKDLQSPVDTAIDALAAAGESDASAFYDTAVAALQKEAQAIDK